MAVCGSSHHGNPDGVQGSGIIMGGGLRLVVVREGESVRQKQEGFPLHSRGSFKEYIFTIHSSR